MSVWHVGGDEVELVGHERRLASGTVVLVLADGSVAFGPTCAHGRSYFDSCLDCSIEADDDSRACPVCDGLHGGLCPIESPDPCYYADELAAGH